MKNYQPEINSEKMKNEILLASRIKKEIIQLLYDKGLFDNYPNKDQVFEQYLIFTDEYLLNKYGKEIKINNDIYYLSDLDYPTSRENIILGLIKKEKLDMVDIKYRMKLTEYEISRILDERSSIKGVSLPLNDLFKIERAKDYISKSSGIMKIIGKK